ncbi:MAG: endo-1,4-beta-xylanase [Bacillota bacterium]|nr:endo-1,4-beta-xylanase [Bacillota bacterium]
MDNRIKTGIENNRKSDCYITIKDKSGNPVSGAKIRAIQKNHEFKFGANLFMLDEMESDEKNKLYKEKFAELFNIATIPIYWKDFEPEKGKPRFAKDSIKNYRRPPLDLCLEYCRENNIEPKAHCLNYIPFTPAWVENTVESQKRELEIRFKALAEGYADLIPGWEVTNELLGVVSLNKDVALFASDDILEWSFNLARKYFPKNKLIINEDMPRTFGSYIFNRSPYFMQIQRALALGAEIDSIGMQYHMFNSRAAEPSESAKFYNPKLLYDVMDLYGRFKLPLQITEITIPDYTGLPEDEDIQAEIIKNLYSIWFSHEAMEAIIYWNLIDGYAAWAPIGDMTQGENIFRGGLLRFDGSEKPSYKILKKLFNEEWHTEADLATNSYGKTDFRGFNGNYELEIITENNVITENITLSKKNDNNYTIIV